MNQLVNLWRKYAYVLLLLFIIVGLFDFRIGLAALICMSAPLIFAVFKGRVWCGQICPRGNFYDRVMSRFSRSRKVPSIVRTVYFRVAVVALLLTTSTIGISQNWGNLYGIGQVFYRLIVITTIVGIVLGTIYNERTWCNFCPMGSLSSLITYFKAKKNGKALLQVGDACVACKRCHKVCPMGIQPNEYKGGALDHYNCIQCQKCALACPKDTIDYK